jgi:hypothetical protein
MEKKPATFRREWYRPYGIADVVPLLVDSTSKKDPWYLHSHWYAIPEGEYLEEDDV